MTRADTIDTAVVRFKDGRAYTLVFGERILVARGYDTTENGYALHPGRPGLIPVTRIGHGYWKQLGA